MGLRCVTGSSATPEKPSEFEFKLFNYTYDSRREVADHPNVNSGLDASGPGIYAYGVDDSLTLPENSLETAKKHSGKNGNGSVFGFSVNMTSSDGSKIPLANEQEPDAISLPEWIKVINAMQEKIRKAHNYDPSSARLTAQEIANSWKEGGDIPLDSQIKKLNETLGGESNKYELRTDKHNNPDLWLKQVRDAITSADPASFITEDFGVNELASMQIDYSEDLWETLTNVWSVCAVERRAHRQISYNELFKDAIRENIEKPELLTAANVNDGLFYVVLGLERTSIDYALTYKYDIDEEKYNKVIDEIIDINSKYFFDLEKPQIRLKINEVTNKNFGIELSDGVFDKIYGTREKESMYSSLDEAIKDELSDRIEVEWEREPGAMLDYKTLPKNELEPAPYESIKNNKLTSSPTFGLRHY